MVRRSSPAMMIAMFVLGACTTVAVQSSASLDAKTSADEPPPDPDEVHPPELDYLPTVIPLAEAPSATAPSGKGSITHLALGRNAYLGLLRMDAGGAVPAHRDATEEYIHVLEGGGIMTIDGESYEVAAGTTVYMPAAAEVSFQNGDAPLVALQVFAGPGPAAKYDNWERGE